MRVRDNVLDLEVGRNMTCEIDELPGRDEIREWDQREPDADEAFELDPQDYAIRFARDSLKLSAVETSDASALVILNLVSKRQVVGEPSVSFGYRLEVSYGLKEDTRCLRPFVDCEVGAARLPGETEEECNDRQDDCFVDDSEEWIRLLSPFGTVNAAADNRIRVELDEAIADQLSPGRYGATLRAIFDNGDTDTVRVRLVKASPSGEYAGELVVWKDHPDNRLHGDVPFQFEMRLQLTDELEQWQDLLQRYNLDEGSDIVDVTEGRVVHGQLHGGSALLFTNGRAESARDDEVPFVGLYSPDTGRIRLLGVIDLQRSFSIAESGAPGALEVENVFDRDIRRRIEFIGPFDEASATWAGLYREKISGLAFEDVTLGGSFLLAQVVADSSELEVDAPLLDDALGTPYPPNWELVADVDELIDVHCGPDPAAPAPPARPGAGGPGGPPPAAGDEGAAEGDGEGEGEEDPVAWAHAQFRSSASFEEYLARAQRRGDGEEGNALGRTTVFPELMQFTGVISTALHALGHEPEDQQERLQDQQRHLNIYDFVSSRVLPCDPEDPTPKPVCIDEDAVRCGLALHQKAILRDWLHPEEVLGDADDPVVGEQDLFCIDTIPTEGCPAQPGEARTLFALQEHNRFWMDAAQILKFDADRARSDAFLVMFRNEPTCRARCATWTRWSAPCSTATSS